MKLPLLSILLFISVITTNAQDTPNKNTPTFGQVLSGHYYNVYQTAMRYNDYIVAKDALYNIYVENPQNDSILFSLSYLYFQNQKYASAVLSAIDVNKLNPENTAALEIMGICYENLGVRDKALEAYESLYLKTDDYQVLYKVAFLQNEQKLYKEARNNANILLGKKEAEELTVVFNVGDKGEKEFPIKVALLNLKGMISKAEGNKTEAKKFIEEALAIAPDFPLAKKALEELDK